MTDVHRTIKDRTDALRDALGLLRHSPVADGVVMQTRDALQKLDRLTAQLRDVDGDQDTDNPTYTERVTGVWGD